MIREFVFLIFRNHTIFYHLTLNTYIRKIIGDPWPFLVRLILLCPQHHLGNPRHHVQLLDDRVHVTGGTTVLKTDEATPGTTINRGEVLKNWVKNEHFFAISLEISITWFYFANESESRHKYNMHTRPIVYIKLHANCWNFLVITGIRVSIWFIAS